MKLLKTFFLIIIILFLIYFLSMNNAEVDIDLLFKKFNQVSISMVIFGALSIGVLLGYIIAVFSVLSTRSQNKNLQNKIKGLNLLNLYHIGDEQVTQLSETYKLAEERLKLMKVERDELNSAIVDLQTMLRDGEKMLNGKGVQI